MGTVCHPTRARILFRLVRAAAPVALLLSMGGCGLEEWVANGFKVGPNYKKPDAQTTSNWIDYQQPAVKESKVDLSRWWSVSNDPVLNSLVKEAAEQNLPLRAAGERIVESRARRGIAIGN